MQIHSSFAALLAQPHLSVITEHGDAELARIAGALDHHALVEGRSDLEELLGQLLAQAERGGDRWATPTPKTLDLIGHSRPGTALLQLGDWVVDGDARTVTAFFRELAEQDVLRRLGIHAVRLLGCNTAGTAEGRRTMTRLADILGVEVYGASNMLFASHYTPTGFGKDWRFLLVATSDLRAHEPTPLTLEGERDPRPLDLDNLPAEILAAPGAVPRLRVDLPVASSLLRLVRRHEGAQMPGLLAAPAYELALPAATAGAFHVLQVMLDGAFLRAYPRGADAPGVLYPVADPAALRGLLAGLPAM